MTESLLQIERIGQSLRVLGDRARVRRLGGYDPYPFQKAAHRKRSGRWEEGQFIDLGSPAKQVLMCAGNQTGKTEFGGTDVAYHATGLYPDGWDGPDLTEQLRQFPLIWCGGADNESVRDIAQSALCGDPHNPEAWGTGWIPLDHLPRDRAILKAGVRDAMDSVAVWHRAGFWVTVGFKSYEAGLLSWAGKPVLLIWLDEEPPQIIYSQCLARMIASQGYIVMTFTPEKGATEVVSQFTTNLKPGQLLMYVGWDDAKHPDGRSHLSEANKAQLLAAFMPHEREMRRTGRPVLGAGAVYPIDVEVLMVDSFPLPGHWPRVRGADFGSGGTNHPTACTALAFDLDNGGWDKVKVYEFWEYRSASQEPGTHVVAINKHSPWIPTGWPHDGHRKEAYATSGVANTYRDLGLKCLLPDHAVNEDGRNLIEPTVFEIWSLMAEGRWKIFRNLTMTIAEQRNYHRSATDNSIVDRHDDLMSSRRVAWMSRRSALPADRKERDERPVYATGVNDYDPRAA